MINALDTAQDVPDDTPRNGCFDRWDIVDAHYWFCVDYHRGQWSEEYARMRRISGYFSPGAGASQPETENGRTIYADLAEREGHDRPPVLPDDPA